MQLGDDDRSNVEDRRGFSGVHLGLGGILVLGALSLIFRQNFFALLGQGGGGTQQTSAQTEQRKEAETGLEHVAVGAFNDTQRYWASAMGSRYRPSKLVLFWDQTQSACGGAQAAMGPFYCPEDEKVYIDLGFYRELAQRFGAPGQFAQAYVIAHEVGHHVQDLLGTTRSAGRDNATSVRIELQADCFAGVWGHSAAQRNLLDPGEAEQGLRAAAAVGDDRLQRMAGRAVNPESFTHGSAAQRSEWFGRGMRSGNADDCNTFQ
jgi:predicted metalloprotease